MGGTGAAAAVPETNQASVAAADVAAAAPARTRMGGGPTAPAAGADGAAGAPAAASRQRMGAGAAGGGGRQRMGGAGQAPTDSGANTAPTTSDDQAASAGSAGARRMGAAQPAGQAAAAAPAASTPLLANAAPSGRAGTPGPAGAATPVKPERPWVKPALIIGGLVVVAALVVLGARWLRTLEGVQEFIATYDGHASQPQTAPVGIPGWLGWQHFLNMFFIVLIIRTGLQVRTERKPPGYWTANKDSFFSPKGNAPKKVSLSQWLHQVLDVLWVLNGVIFIVLLFATGHWMRIVPTSWDIVPNMISGAIQYASLDWPAENGWVHYNALQVMAYFTTVFIAAPLAILSGLRFSTWWPERAERLNRLYPVEWARAVHFPVMLYFVAFTIVHVFLVFFTGALANLNHMYTSRDVVDWWGLVIFLVSLAVIAAAWFLTKPMFTTPIAARMGKVSK